MQAEQAEYDLQNSKNIDFEEDRDIEANVEMQLRRAFIGKVFGIIGFQLLITTLFVLLTYKVDWVKEIVSKNVGSLIVVCIAAIALTLVMVCNRPLMKQVPLNYFLLTIWTLMEAYIVASICLEYEEQSVLMALAVTAAATFGLTAYAFFTKRDFTLLGGLLFSCLLGSFVTGLFLVFFPIPIIHTLYLMGGIVLYSCYLIFDVQLIVGNKAKKIEMDEYMFAAMNVYLDILNLFIKILRLFGKKKK